MKHLRKFTNDAAYEAATLNYPSVSLIGSTGEVKYDPIAPGPSLEMVDLGLPSGLLWAKKNLGAQSESEAGNYYQWGATTPLNISGTTVNPAADWTDYVYANGSFNALTKYCNNPELGYNSFTDSLTTLESSDDVATFTLGNGYRIPTDNDMQELLDETNHEWTSINGVNGWKFINKLDSTKYIFLPQCGVCHESSLMSDMNAYISSSLDETASYASIGLMFDNENLMVGGMLYRSFGLPVRPVRSANS